MYAFLNDSVTSRIVDLLRDLAKQNPAYSDMVDNITDAFPYEKVKQRGVYVSDTSFNHRPLSADNYIGTLISHVFAAKVGLTPTERGDPQEQPTVSGHFIEWVREDYLYYNQSITEDLSYQIGSGNDIFITTHGNWLASLDAKRVPSIHDIKVLVDGVQITPFAVNPVLGSFRIPWQLPNSTVKVSYFYRRIPNPSGLYFLKITSPNTLSKRLMGIVRKNLLVEKYNGETSFTLPHQNLIPNSIRVHTATNFTLHENLHYSINNITGVISILTPDFIPNGRSLYVSYRWAGLQEDDLPIEAGTSSNKIIPGVIIAFGEKLKEGDMGVVGVLPERIDIAQIFGGKFEGSLGLTIYARDPDTREEIVDWLSVYIQGYLKEKLENQGIALTNFSIGGKSRASYFENEEDFFTQDLSLSLLTDWELHKSFPLRVEGFDFRPPGSTDLLVPAPISSVLVTSPENFDAAFTALEIYK